MKTSLRTTFAFLLVLAAAAGTSAKDKDGPRVVERVDIPLQRSWFVDPKAPRECNHTFVIPGQVCWTVQSVAWRTLNKEQKGLHLAVNVWGDDASRVDFTRAALTIALDGKVIELPSMEWAPGAYRLQGNTALVKDEALIRMIAGAHEVWLTAMATPRASVKLSPRTLESIKAVVDQYDVLDATSRSIVQLDAKLNELNQQLGRLVQQVQKFQSDEHGCETEGCVNRLREIAPLLVQNGEAAMALFDARIVLLNAGPQDEVTLEEKKKTTELRQEMSEVLRDAKAWLSSHQK